MSVSDLPSRAFRILLPRSSTKSSIQSNRVGGSGHRPVRSDEAWLMTSHIICGKFSVPNARALTLVISLYAMNSLSQELFRWCRNFFVTFRRNCSQCETHGQPDTYARPWTQSPDQERHAGRNPRFRPPCRRTWTKVAWCAPHTKWGKIIKIHRG